ncbi:transposable element Tc3 transposase [Trichonephila clavipes]|uniref:Transposable element Tc3 transposase n=1 Tax=Trichonephila clavipes TaxID=2585209 RepID=A0A8X6RCK1_TRICX|nr:transposable element Tc3 transposase [Trichonephila clavipes]
MCPKRLYSVCLETVVPIAEESCRDRSDAMLLQFLLEVTAKYIYIPVLIRRCIEVKVGITFQDGDRFNTCQVIYSQFGLAIHQNDHQARRRFIERAQNEIAVVPDFHERILFSDEAHFWLNGYVNKQNCRIWSEANTQVYLETPLHPEKLTVWSCDSNKMAQHVTQLVRQDTFGDRLISRFGPVNWPPRSCDLTPLDYFFGGLCKVIGLCG